MLNLTNQGNTNQATMRYYLTPVRTAIRKTRHTKWRKVNPHALLVGMLTDAVLCKTVWQFPTKLSIEILMI